MPTATDLPDVDTQSWLQYQAQQLQDDLNNQIDADGLEHQFNQHIADLGSVLQPQQPPPDQTGSGDQGLQLAGAAPPITPDQLNPQPQPDLSQVATPAPAPPEPSPAAPAPDLTQPYQAPQPDMTGAAPPITPDMLNPQPATPDLSQQQPAAPATGVAPPFSPQDLLSNAASAVGGAASAVGTTAQNAVQTAQGVAGPITQDILTAASQPLPAEGSTAAPAPVPTGVAAPITQDQLTPQQAVPTVSYPGQNAPGAPLTTGQDPFQTPIASAPTLTRDQTIAAGAQVGLPADEAGYLYDAGVKSGIDPGAALAIIKLEGNVHTANNNMFDIQGGDGVTPVPQGDDPRWGAYTSHQASIDDFYNLINNHYLNNGQTTIGTVMHGPGSTMDTDTTHAYAPIFENDKYYPQKVVDQVAQWANLPGGVPGGSPGGYTVPTTADLQAGRVAGGRPSQFSDPTIDNATAKTICGPAAAIAFARATGRDPTLAEAMQMAQARNDWSEATGMYGIGAEADLLKGMGVATHVTSNVDWSQVQADIAKGNPVILDTPGHYFVVDGYNQDTGQYHFGTSTSDLVKANHQEWFTPDQAANLGMGDFRGALYIDNAKPAGSQAASSSQSQSPTAPGVAGAQQLVQDAQAAVNQHAQDLLDQMDQQHQQAQDSFNQLQQNLRDQGGMVNQFLNPTPTADQTAARSSAGMVADTSGLPSYAGGVPPSNSALGVGGSPQDFGSTIQTGISNAADIARNAWDQFAPQSGQAPGSGFADTSLGRSPFVTDQGPVGLGMAQQIAGYGLNQASADVNNAILQGLGTVTGIEKAQQTPENLARTQAIESAASNIPVLGGLEQNVDQPLTQWGREQEAKITPETPVLGGIEGMDPNHFASADNRQRLADISQQYAQDPASVAPADRQFAQQAVDWGIQQAGMLAGAELGGAAIEGALGVGAAAIPGAAAIGDAIAAEPGLNGIAARVITNAARGVATGTVSGFGMGAAAAAAPALVDPSVRNNPDFVQNVIQSGLDQANAMSQFGGLAGTAGGAVSEVIPLAARGLGGLVSAGAERAPGEVASAYASTGEPINGISGEADALVRGADSGSLPTDMSSNIARIAQQHGIDVSPDTTPQEVADQLRAIRDQPAPAPVTAPVSQPGPATQQLLDTADRGGIPLTTRSPLIQRAAAENGIRITPDMTPQDAIAQVRAASQAAPPSVEAYRPPVTGETNGVMGSPAQTRLSQVENEVSRWQSSGVQAPPELLQERADLRSQVGAEQPRVVGQTAQSIENGVHPDGPAIMRQAAAEVRSDPVNIENYRITSPSPELADQQISKDINTVNRAAADVGAARWNADGSPANWAARQIPLIEDARRGAPATPDFTRQGFQGRPIEMTEAEQIARARLDKFPPDIRDAIEQSLRSNNWFNDARRGVMSDEVVRNMAADWANSTDLRREIEQWRPGTAYNAEEIVALQHAHAMAGAEVTWRSAQIADMAARGEDIPRETLQAFLQAHDVNDRLSQMVEGGRAESGRGLRQWQHEVGSPYELGQTQETVQTARQAMEDAATRQSVAETRAQRADQLGREVQQLDEEQRQALAGRRAEPLPTELEPGHIEARPGRMPAAMQSLEYRDRLFNNIADAYENLKQYRAMSLDQKEADWQRLLDLRGNRVPRQLEDPEVLLQQLQKELAAERKIFRDQTYGEPQAQPQYGPQPQEVLRARADQARADLQQLRDQWARDPGSVPQDRLDAATRAAQDAEWELRRGVQPQAEVLGQHGPSPAEVLRAQASAARRDVTRAAQDQRTAYDQQQRYLTRQQAQAGEMFQQMRDRGLSEDYIKRAASSFDHLVSMNAEPIAFSKWWQTFKSDPVGWSDWMRALSYNSMISGVKTIERIFISGALNNVYSLMRDEKPLASAKGALLGLSKSGQLMAETMKYGNSVQRILDRVEGQQYRPTLTERVQLGNYDPRFTAPQGAAVRGAQFLEFPGRIHSSINELVESTSFYMSVYRDLALEAEQKGLTGQAEADYITNGADEVSRGLRPDLSKSAREYAQTVSLRGDLGKMLGGISQIGRIPGVGQLIMPFTRIATNMATRMIDVSPFGIAGTVRDVMRNPEYRNTRSYADVQAIKDAQGNQVYSNVTRPFSNRAKDNLVGTLLAAAAYGGATQGWVTAAGPSNTQRKDQLTAQGWQPYSLRIADHYIPYRFLGQFAFPLALGSSIFESGEYAKDDQTRNNILNRAGDTGRRLADFAANESFMNDAAAVMNGLSNPDRYGNTLVTGLASRVVPYGALGQNIAQSTEGTARAPYSSDIATNVGTHIGAMIPGVANLMPERQNALGQPIQQGWWTGILPETGTYAPPDPVLGELTDRGVTVPAPSKVVATTNGTRAIELTPEEMRQMNADQGQLVRDSVSRVTDTSNYANATDEQKSQMLQRAVSLARRQAEQNALRSAYEQDPTRLVDARRFVGTYIPQPYNTGTDVPGGVTASAA